ncbi:MAG: hypothetical protein LBH43_01585 [Treponema sp.]|jgi:hypothetical protein|nr:hypothetical protein [Treponema sp.]
MMIKQLLTWFDEFAEEWRKAVKETVEAFTQALENNEVFQEIKLVIKKISEVLEAQKIKQAKQKESRRYASYNARRLLVNRILLQVPHCFGQCMGGAGGINE